MVQQGADGQQQQQLEKKLSAGHWIRRYSFDCDRGPIAEEEKPMGAWVEGDGILCFLIGDHLYKYDTSKDHDKRKDEEDVVGSHFSAWDQNVWLPSPPNGYYKRRGIYGGYRPTLLSPGDLGAQHDVDVGEQFQHAWLRALRRHKSSNQQCLPDNGSDQHDAKRMRS